MKGATPMILALGAGFLLAGCATTTKAPAPALKSAAREPAPHLPPTPMGARTARTGSASAELDREPEAVFDLTQDLLRQRYKMKFVNRRVGRLEAESKNLLYSVELTPLTTGKTGLSVTVTNREDKTADLMAARDLADQILQALSASPKTTPVVPLKESSVPSQER